MSRVLRSHVRIRSACLAVLMGTWAWAGEPPVTSLESSLKAAYLINFLSFVDYPDSEAQAARTICVLDEDPLGAALDAAAKTRTAARNPVSIRRIAAPTQAQACHVLYLPLSQAQRVRSGLEKIRSRPILTVGEGPDFLEQGGIVLFYFDAGRLQFEINLDSARRAGLRLSSKLMVLSRSAR